MDGESLFSITDTDIDGSESLTQEEKDGLKKFIKELKEKNPETQEKEIIITKESEKDDITKYLKEKLNISDKGIEALDLDAESLFSIEESDIDSCEELTQDEKDKIKKFLTEIKEKNQKEKPSEENKDIKKDDIPKIELSKIENIQKESNLKENNKNVLLQNLKNEEEKEKIEKEQKLKENEVINKEKNIENMDKNNKEVNQKLRGQNKNLNKDKDKDKDKDKGKNKDKDKNKDKNKGKNKEKIKDPLSKGNDFEIIENNEKKINKEYDGIKSNKIQGYSINNYKIQPLITDAKYNIFFLLPFLEKMINDLNIYIYLNESNLIKSSYTLFKYYFINEYTYINIYNEQIKCLLVQIPLNKAIHKLTIDLSIENQYQTYNYNTEIDVKYEANNYYYLDNINNRITLTNNRIITYYLNFFLDETTKIEEIFKKNLIKSLIDKISENSIELNVINILKFIKSCLRFKLEPKNIDYIEARIEEKKYRKPLNEELYVSSDDIDILTIKKEREKIKLIKLIVQIYANYDKDFLMKLVVSKNGKECSRAVLDLLYNKKLNLRIYLIKKKKNVI